MQGNRVREICLRGKDWWENNAGYLHLKTSLIFISLYLMCIGLEGLCISWLNSYVTVMPLRYGNWVPFVCVLNTEFKTRKFLRSNIYKQVTSLYYDYLDIITIV